MTQESFKPEWKSNRVMDDDERGEST